MMTFSEMLDAAWEMASAAEPGLTVTARVSVRRGQTGDDAPRNRAMWNIWAERTANHPLYVGEWVGDASGVTPERALEEFRKMLEMVIPATQAVIDSIDVPECGTVESADA